MPRHSTLATAIDKHAIASDVVYLVLLEVNVLDPQTNSIVEVVRLVNNNENLQWKGDTYLAANFEIDVTFEHDRPPQVSLALRDQLQVIQARMQAYGGMMGSTVRMIVINASTPDNPPELDEKFNLISAHASASDYVIQFTVGAENPLGLRFPPRLQYRNRCFWQYKGVECGYTGTNPSCDFTMNGPNGCEAHSNSIRFGGFPGLRAPTWGG